MLNLKLVFNRSNRLRTKDGKGKLHLRATFERTPAYFDTKILLSPKQWNDRKSIVVAHPDADQINDDLEDLILNANRYYRKCRREKKRFSVDRLFYELHNVVSDIDFLEFSKSIHQSEIGVLAKSTIAKRVDLFNRLENFRSEIFMSDIDFVFLDNFKQHLFSQKAKKGTLLGANYISSLFTVLKKFVRAARIQGFIKIDPFLGFKVAKVAKIITVLNEDELQLIWDYKPKGKYKRARLYVLFLAFTGMRVGDMSQIKESMFMDGMLKFVAGKTEKRKGKLARIPLHLFDNRAYDLFVECGGFKKYNNYDLNVAFRELLQLVGIDKYMTIHELRHSFKSIMLERGYPLHIIAEMMAHSSTTTTAKYGSISDTAIKKLLIRN